MQKKLELKQEIHTNFSKIQWSNQSYLFSNYYYTFNRSFYVWKEEFNYAIIDEASQMFLEEALPILYLAQIKVFAGDKEQMQPTRWFASSYGEYIEDEDETLNISSILDHAVSEGVYQNLLDKNYRSQHAALMTFNSKEFYNSQLDIINQFGSKFLNCIEVFNLDGAWINGQNLVEADFVIKNFRKSKQI